MAILDSLKEGYFSLEDKWYGLVDKISSKIPAFGKLIDSLEEKKIPTFPLAIVIIVIIIALLASLVVLSSNSTYTLTVKDDQGVVLEGATVTILQGGNELQSLDTGADGKVSFALANGDYTVKVDSTGHSSQQKSITLAGNTDDELVLTLEDATISKAVYLRSSSGALVTGTGSVLYRCTGDSEDQLASYANGQFTAKVKESCPSVEITSVNGFDLVTSTASFAGNSSVTVTEKNTDTGQVNVVLSIDGSAGAVVPAGLQVKLVPIDGTTPLVEITQGTNLVSFSDVPVQKYSVSVNSADGNFAPYNGSALGLVQDVLKGETTTFNVTLKLSSATSIIVNVKDADTKLPIQGAEVKLTSTTDPNDVTPRVTGATGQVIFSVAQNTSYTITADQPDYVVGTTQSAMAGDNVELLLVKASAQNQNSLLVSVVDGDKNPVENARVILKKINGSTEDVIGEKTTDSAGKAEFFNLELNTTYLANVSKEGFGSQNSTTIQVAPRRQTPLEVTFDIAKGKISVKVLDPQKNPLSGVSVKPMNYFTSQQETSAVLTSTDGIAEFNIRADKKIYFVVESSTYSKYFTAAMYPQPNGVTDKEITLSPKGAAFSMMPIEIFSGTDALNLGSDSSQAQISQGAYTVVAKLQVPKGTFSEAGIHLRTGKQESAVNLMEEDGLYLSSVDSSGKITRGTTYSPPNGYDNDAKNLTQGNAKWANSVWRNPQEGTYEVEAEITVTETDPAKPLEIYYRGWAKGSTVLRDPAGTTAAQNELYSLAKKKVLSAGSSSLCSDNFCKSMTIEALTGDDAGRKIFVSGVGTAQLKKGITYELTADLTNYSGRPINGANLIVEGKGLDVSAVQLNGADETATNAISIGTIGVDMPLQVKVTFTPSAAGSAGVRLAISSESEYKLDETVTVNVKPNKVFSLEMVPKVVVPYIDNELFFSATDGNEPLQGVLITIKSDNDVLATVQTTGEGLARYELTSPSLGDSLTITAQKEGYNTIEFVKTVDKGLLTITPPEISETMKIGEITALTEGIILQNDTAKDIEVNGITVSGDLKAYMDATVAGANSTTVIPQGKDKNYSITLKLNSNAQRLIAPKDVTGTVLINTDIAGAHQSFASEIPMSIHLSMPGYLDNAKCLQISPSTLDFVTSDNDQTKTITLTNSCTAEGTTIALHNLEAKLSEAAKFGTITISGGGFKATPLTDKYAKVSDFFDKDAATDLTVTFSPNVSVASGTQSFTVYVNGKNALEDGTEEKTEAQLKTSTTMSSLSKCIEIVKPDSGIILDMAPWNLGYGALASSNYSPYTSAYGSTYGGFTNQNSPYSMPYMAGMGMGGYGTAGYGAGYANTFYSGTPTGAASTSNYQQSSFTINNNCSMDVDFTLDVDARISVSEQKFTISKDSSEVIDVQPGYVLGKYSIKVNAKAVNTDDAKKSLGNVSVVVRRLGDVDTDCIKTNMTELNLNSFVMRPQQYSVFNYCYDTGVQLSRNQMASIECSAPSSSLGNSGVSYFQYGVDPSYYANQGYPLGGAYNNYNDYVHTSAQQNGCSAGTCSLISGTRVRNRTVQPGDAGSIERVDFDVMPSAQYIPQQKLFNQNSGTYGPFQSVGDFRSWATSTDARTNVYGSLKVAYNNQYGIGQCMEFPITVSNIWGLGESLDSAFNWGDPSADPRECQNKEALNLTKHYSDQDKLGNPMGAIPESEYTGGKDSPVFFYLAQEPRALQIGPSPAQNSTNYPLNNYYAYTNNVNQQQNNNNKAGLATKNCGLLDSIDIKTVIPPEQAFGARITIAPETAGSLTKNTKGSTLSVQVDRSGMQADCVRLNVIPITAKVSRAASFDSADLTWPLSILITKNSSIVLKSEADVQARCKIITTDVIADCQNKLTTALASQHITSATDPAGLKKVLDEFVAANPGCAPYATPEAVQGILGQAQAQNNCSINANDAKTGYGFNLIGKTGTDFANSADLESLCSTQFCSSTQLQLCIYNKLGEIESKIPANYKYKLSELYKNADHTPVVKNCAGADLNFYKNESEVLMTDDYKLVNLPSDVKTSIINAGSATALNTDNIAIDKMRTQLGNIPAKDKNSVLLEVDYNKEYASQFTAFGFTVVGTKAYMSVDRYADLLRVVFNNAQTCATKGTACVIKGWCNSQDITIQPTDSAFLAWISSHSPALKKGVYEKDDMSIEDQERIYRGNSTLNMIHSLATFDSSRAGYNSSVTEGLLLTSAPAFVKPAQELFKKFTLPSEKYTLNFKADSVDMGRHNITLDFDVEKIKDAAVNVDVVLSKDANVTGLPSKMTSNVLLQKDFVTTDAGTAVFQQGIKPLIVSSAGVFSKKVPVLLTATLQNFQTSLVYYLNSTTLQRPPNSLINWYNGAGVLVSVDSKVTGTQNFSITVPGAPSTVLKGMYYYPDDGGLVFLPSQKGTHITTRTLVFPATAETKDVELTSQPWAFQVEYKPSSIILDDIVKQVKDGSSACVDAQNNIVWNEDYLIKK